MLTRFALALASLAREIEAGAGPEGAHAAMERALALGARAVHLDATRLRARDLDRSARRDLASRVRRDSIAVSGWDALIPPAHFASGAHKDRAMAALAGAIDLAAEVAVLAPESHALGGALVCVEAIDDAEARAAAIERAASRGVALAGFSTAGGTEGLARCVVLDDAPEAARLAGASPGEGALVGVRWRGGRVDAVGVRAVLDVIGCGRPVIVEVPAGAEVGRFVGRARSTWG